MGKKCGGAIPLGSSPGPLRANHVKGIRHIMLVATLENDREVPLPRVVAEALVNRLSQPEVIERAKAEGLPEQVVATAVKVCGCGKQVLTTPGAVQ